MDLTLTKRFGSYPAAHRQPKHDGHCALIHGHNWSFELTFAADTLDPCGFIADVGKMGPIKRWFTHHFDHTFLLNIDDPERDLFENLSQQGLIRLVLVEDCSMEGLCCFIFEGVSVLLKEMFPGRYVRLARVVCYEDEKNSACLTLTP